METNFHLSVQEERQSSYKGVEKSGIKIENDISYKKDYDFHEGNSVLPIFTHS